MYMKDKSNRITLRLNDEQMNYVASSADLYGVSPSEFLRMVITVTMLGGNERRENEQADFNNKLQQ